MLNKKYDVLIKTNLIAFGGKTLGEEMRHKSIFSKLCLVL